MVPYSLHLASLTMQIKLSQAKQITLENHPITFERSGKQWAATGWKAGLPIARRPVSAEYILQILQTEPYLVSDPITVPLSTILP